MTTAKHDTSIRWMDCPVCAELHREVERADAEADKAWETFSFFDATYREARDAGMVGFGTTAWTQWHDLLDQLRHAYYDATDTARARLAAWGESIREHDKPQTTAETPERKIAISKADAADELVNVYGGHIDKWLEALRARSFAQTAEPMPRDRDAYERLWYGDVPEITLPPSFACLDAMTLTHCSRAIGLYLRVLKQYAPVSDDASHVAHRLMDAFDDDIADDEACTIPETTVFAYDAKQGRCRSFRFGGMLDTAAACAQANCDGYLTGLKDVRDLIGGMIADHDEDTDGGDEACTDEGGV